MPIPHPTMYREHRARLIAELAREGAAAVLPTATLKVRNHDSTYRFRPDSDFWYLTGFAEPEAILVLLGGLPDAEDEDLRAPRSVLFLRERDPEQETWTGRRLGIEAAPEALGVDEARDTAELWESLPDLLAGYARVHYRTGLDERRDREMLRVVDRLRGRARTGSPPVAELVDPATLVHELRLFKSPEELERMRRAACVTREAHLAAMEATAPGVGEEEIDALIEYTFLRRGCTGAAYTNIVAGGANACILHYVENDQPLADGELLLIDAGAEHEYYAADVTRTFPVNGTFSEEQRALYEVVLDAQLAAIAEVRPGVPFDRAHEVATERLVAGLLRLGLLEGEPQAIIAEGAHRRFYMHRTGHWLGLDVHDCGAYSDEGGASRALAPGMVTTIEPGLYIAPDDETVEARWRGIGVRIEDDVLVTAEGAEVLTADIPKTVEEIEAACAGSHLDAVRS
ncbi:MAG: aminopeptidase P N-terminal domain-containing protein [Planctomycetota bacterium]|jgi:Xaa-Pro aminopeptidase|nr:aminopeptidase P N-terminal domain-containing protein [Planctomycetota bacterium]MDP6762623.1 aminopeptidase P N-terminal domain-containing protein [Planctomycetota bacterium]MDP6988470.1 aminopeptidase P N-terminal domain-containing protein [Planctomycetota bacterium]